MRIHVVDPAAYTPPYDFSLCRALAERGLEVDLVTGPSTYRSLPPPEGYRLVPLFYPLTARLQPSRGARRRALQLAEHIPGMLRYAGRVKQADVVHYQWFVIEQLDALLLPRTRPRVMTAHDVLPRETRTGQRQAARRLLRRMDAVVVHSRNGALRLEHDLGIDSERIHVIPHGAFDYLTRLSSEDGLPHELREVRGTVVLYFGMIRPYKGVDVLVEAFRGIEAAELWIVGAPRIPLDPLVRAAEQGKARVRFYPRFIPDSAVPAFFRRADVVVLPYREIDQSGVLYTALAFGKPLVATDVGGFPEVIEEHGLGLLARPGDAESLGEALDKMVQDVELRRRCAEAAGRAAKEHYSWSSIAERTVALYQDLRRA